MVVLHDIPYFKVQMHGQSRWTGYSGTNLVIDHGSRRNLQLNIRICEHSDHPGTAVSGFVIDNRFRMPSKHGQIRLLLSPELGD